MASVIIALKVMPSSPGIDLKVIESEGGKIIAGFGGKVVKAEVAPVAFGLKSITFHFVIPESSGSTEPLEKKMSSIKDVNSVEVVDVRRAVG